MTEYTIRKYDMTDYEIAKDTMTLQDIAKYLENIKRGYVGDYNFTGDEDDFERYKLKLALSKATEIIKKIAESEE